MPVFSPKFFSIVFIGRQNPQILNHDFLINNRVLPTKREPFKSLIRDSSENTPPFTEYLSTPVVTTLVYKWISIIVEEGRFQIKDNNFGIPSKSPIISITKKYFGEHLRYTPFQLGGINFAGKLNFTNENDEITFDKKFGIDCKTFAKYFKIEKKVQYSTKLNYPLNEDRIELRVDKSKKHQEKAMLSFNFEFTYDNIDSFISKLDEVDGVYKVFKEMLKKLKTEINQ
jgi:hypothetical protein